MSNSKFFQCAWSLSVLLVAVTGSKVFGFGGPPGGPFSNGSYFPNDGTFSAVVRGTNLSGTLQFSTTHGAGPEADPTAQVGNGTISTITGGGVGSTGVANIYYDGDTLRGNSQGSLNAEASTMSVNFQATGDGQGQNDFTYTNTTSGLVRQVFYFDALNLNGFANCKTSNSYPNQKFEGDGEAEFQYLNFEGNTPFLDTFSFPVNISGVRLSNTASSFNVTSVRPPSVNEYTITDP